MNLISEKHSLSGHITVPGSKSHTIRALVLASLAEGTSVIKNPLASNDCKSAAKAIQKIGAKISGFPEESVWTVTSSAKDLHLPDDIIDVENSGSTLYFFAPICATYPGISVFTGDSSIRKRPVLHLIDALNQLGAQAKVTQPGKNAPPFGKFTIKTSSVWPCHGRAIRANRRNFFAYHHHYYRKYNYNNS